MPDCKSLYLTASRPLSQYGRKIINNKNMLSHPSHKTSKNWIKANQAITTEVKKKKVNLKDLFRYL